MIAIDSNILIYSRRRESEHFESAQSLVATLARGSQPWALPWPCAYEFLRVVTHHGIFKGPHLLQEATDDLQALFESPSIRLLGQGSGHFPVLVRCLSRAEATGNLIYDGSIAALCIEHNVSELWTANTKHFSRFAGLAVRNPLV